MLPVLVVQSAEWSAVQSAAGEGKGDAQPVSGASPATHAWRMMYVVAHSRDVCPYMQATGRCSRGPGRGSSSSSVRVDRSSGMK